MTLTSTPRLLPERPDSAGRVRSQHPAGHVGDRRRQPHGAGLGVLGDQRVCPRVKEIGVEVQGAHLNPLGLYLRTSIPFIWRILSAFLPA
jgi:hypothetical protein